MEKGIRNLQVINLRVARNTAKIKAVRSLVLSEEEVFRRMW